MFLRQQSILSVSLLALTIGAFAVGVVGCAPEPGAAAGSIDKETQTTSPETQWGGQDAPAEDLQTTLPDSFPKNAFVLPTNVTVYNAGERDSGQWFVVLRAADVAAGTELWDSIASASSLEETDRAATTEGGVTATLSNSDLRVQALTIPQPDGSVLLNYDLAQVS